MDIKAVLDVVETAGLIGVLVLILVGGAREWWVYGRFYRAALEDRDEWKRMALTGTELADRAVQVASGRRR